MEILEIQPADVGWGLQTIVDLYGCPVDLLTDPDNILAFKSDLISKANMVEYGEPLLEHFATQKEETAGYSLVQLIETSALVCHFAENIGKNFVDFYSCKGYPPKIVIDACIKYFQPTSYNVHVHIRGLGEEGAHKVVAPVIQHLCGSMGRA